MSEVKVDPEAEKMDRVTEPGRVDGRAVYPFSATTRHGVASTYTSYGCRCRACTTAHTEYGRQLRHRRGEACACGDRWPKLRNVPTERYTLTCNRCGSTYVNWSGRA